MLGIRNLGIRDASGPCAPNKKCTPKGELTLRTSVITHGSKGELALRGIFFIWRTQALTCIAKGVFIW